MSVRVDSLKTSNYLSYQNLEKYNAANKNSLFVSEKSVNAENKTLFEENLSDTKDKKNKVIKAGVAVAILAALAFIITKGTKILKVPEIDLEMASGFSFGTKKLLSYENISKKFVDETTKFCDVSIKGSDCVEYFFSNFKNKLPAKYIGIDDEGQKFVKECIELETFEMLNKGKGLGSKKIQEIIEYAKERTEGRFYLMAQKIRGNVPPLLFYYKNGLRSVDEGVNLILEKISKGELPYSRIPNQTVMYLP